MRPEDLYKRTPLFVHRELYPLLRHGNGGFVPEVEERHAHDIKDDASTRVEIRYYRNHCYDGRRSWTLASVWFDDQPVMVIQSAGRDGDDHVARFVTHPDRYREMVQHLMSLIPIPEVRDCVKPDEDVPGLASFYGDSLDNAEVVPWGMT